MSESALKVKLAKLGLRQAEFARLLDVSPRTVNQWANGAQPLPGAVSGYLRLLEAAEPGVRAAELDRVDDRVRHLREGIYIAAYRPSLGAESPGHAVLVLRGGQIAGGNSDGDLFTGSYRYDRAKATNAVHLQFGSPAPAPAPASADSGGPAQPLRTAFNIARAEPLASATAVIEEDLYEIDLRFLGPLPD